MDSRRLVTHKPVRVFTSGSFNCILDAVAVHGSHVDQSADVESEPW